MSTPQKRVFVCTQNRPVNHPRGACSHKGASDVLEAFWQQLQQRNAYDKVAITYSGCLGPCDQGANVLVYPEGVLYGNVRKEDVNEIFERHLLGDEPVARLRIAVEA
jgi:(2Fe-2S) ferredoxin